MFANKEININGTYGNLRHNNTGGDLQFIVMEKFLSQDNELSLFERLVLKIYFWIKDRSLSEERGFGLDQSNVKVEKFPLIVAPVTNLGLKRVYHEE
jgi:KUP system potassium uptake protein